MQKLPQKTPNKTQEHIEKLAELFPNVISEGKVDFDLLRQLLSEDLVEGADERYRLDWVGKRASLLKANRSINKTLRPCVDESVNFDTTENLYIEGDNFEVLKLIGESYLNKIKMIYIDPPYNTGKDFVYRDNFTTSKAEYEEELGLRDEEANKLFKNTDSNGRFHSDWLSMMYERLLLSRDLLKDDGVIFISIDDNEVHNLRKICDEVFGESNYVQEIIWEKKFSPQNDAKYFSLNHEQVLCYAKNKSLFKRNLLPMSEEQKARYKNPDNDPRGDWQSDNFTVATYSKDYDFPIEKPNGEIANPTNGRCWATSKENYLKLLEDKRIWFGLNGSGVPRIKRFLSEIQQGRVPISIFYHSEVGHTQEASKELKAIFEDKKYFDYPKPVRLLQQLTNIATNENDIILDFFSGSATTAHAVMQLNAEDQGNRKFIMVQLPEKTNNEEYPTIAEIGKERIRRAGEKILKENTDKEGIENLDIGFRVLKVDSSNMKEVYYHPSELNQSLFAQEEAENNIKEDRETLDLLFATMLDLGIELSLKITPHQVDEATLYAVENNELVACFDENISLEVIEAIKALSPYQVVLKDGSFASDSDKINAVESLSKVATVSVL